MPDTPVHRSVSGLKKQLMDARARKEAAVTAAAADGEDDADAEPAAPSEPVEWGRIFSEEDFERIRCSQSLDEDAQHCRRHHAC